MSLAGTVLQCWRITIPFSEEKLGMIPCQVRVYSVENGSVNPALHACKIKLRGRLDWILWHSRGESRRANDETFWATVSGAFTLFHGISFDCELTEGFTRILHYVLVKNAAQKTFTKQMVN